MTDVPAAGLVQFPTPARSTAAGKFQSGTLMPFSTNAPYAASRTVLAATSDFGLM
jgi:hypothetical protein